MIVVRTSFDDHLAVEPSKKEGIHIMILYHHDEHESNHGALSDIGMTVIYVRVHCLCFNFLEFPGREFLKFALPFNAGKHLLSGHLHTIEV